MDFTEPAEITDLRLSVRRFLSTEVSSDEVRTWDREDAIPRSMMAKLAKLGLFGVCVPEEFGGLGRNVVAFATVMTELSRCSSALSSLFSMNASYGALNVSEYGSPEQRKRLLPRLLAGEVLFSYGLSEPDVGADLADVRTTAVRAGDRVVIRGSKRWTSGANIADYIYCLVRSGPVESRRQNLSFVIVPTDAPGLTITTLPTMGTRGVPTCDVVLDDVVVSVADVMGGEAGWNAGWGMLTGRALEVEKLNTSAMALGFAEGALAEAWEYSQQRVQGGRKICGHQSIRHVLADCQVKVHACRLMVREAAWRVQEDHSPAVATSMSKLYVAETAKEVVLACQQVLGAYGYAEGLNMERYVRDILAVPIYGGSSAIQRNNVVNLLGLPKG
jgi:alkylation response protein AidB-like acyl-CoA dehydrogenase